MKKLLNYALSANNLIKQIGFKKFINMAKDDLSFKVLDTMKKRKILFLAPHPDDDVFSSGGTLAKFVKAESEIKIVYFNDGAGGTKDGKNDSKLVDIRKKEATQATKILGITDLVFLNNNVIASPASAEKPCLPAGRNLLKIINDFNPEIIFVPSIVDNHPTHKDVTKLLYTILACHPERSKGSRNSSAHNSQLSNLNSQVWQYEVWTPIIPNQLIKIDEVIEQKKKAILCHKSQLECRDYLNAIIDFNSYRAKSMGAGDYAEGFFVSNIETFKIMHG